MLVQKCADAEVLDEKDLCQVDIADHKITTFDSSLQEILKDSKLSVYPSRNSACACLRLVTMQIIITVMTESFFFFTN